MSWSFTNKTEVVMRETSKDRDVVIPVILPTRFQKGVYHAEIRTTVMIRDDRIIVEMVLQGEAGFPLETIRREYTADDLHVSSAKR